MVKVNLGLLLFVDCSVELRSYFLRAPTSSLSGGSGPEDVRLSLQIHTLVFPREAASYARFSHGDVQSAIVSACLCLMIG